MLKAYEYRIYPTPQQEEIFNKTLGLSRLYWNIVVAAKREDNKTPILTPIQAFTKFKPEALAWAKEVDSVPVGQVWTDLRCAFSAFFKSIKKERKGKFIREPRFKSKKNPKDSFRYSNLNIPKFKDGKLWISKRIGPLDIRASCRFCEGKFLNTTFRRTPTGKWFVKICVEKKEEKKCDNGKLIGLDWNCGDEDFIVRSDGTRDKCPRYMKRKEKRLAKLQKTLSRRCVKGAETQSSNYEKAKFQVAKLHEKVAWQRKDFLHKLSRELANNYEFVAVEDINLQVMASGLHHGKVIGDQGFGMLRQMLAYKTNLLKVNPKNTSKTCCVCGHINKKLTLSDRHWQCPVCETKHDRDVNAAKNIMRLGRGLSERGINACGEPSSSMKQESPGSSEHEFSRAE